MKTRIKTYNEIVDDGIERREQIEVAFEIDHDKVKRDVALEACAKAQEAAIDLRHRQIAEREAQPFHPPGH